MGGDGWVIKARTVTTTARQISNLPLHTAEGAAKPSTRPPPTAHHVLLVAPTAEREGRERERERERERDGSAARCTPIGMPPGTQLCRASRAVDAELDCRGTSLLSSPAYRGAWVASSLPAAATGFWCYCVRFCAGSVGNPVRYEYMVMMMLMTVLLLCGAGSQWPGCSGSYSNYLSEVGGYGGCPGRAVRAQRARRPLSLPCLSMDGPTRLNQQEGSCCAVQVYYYPAISPTCSFSLF